MAQGDHPSQRTQLRRLSPEDPLDHLRLLWWVLVMPQRLKAHRDTFGEKDERRVGKWLTSTLIWLPLGIPTLALSMGVLPRSADAFPAGFYLGCLSGLVLAWTLTRWLGNIDLADSVADVAPIGRAGVVALGVVLAIVFGTVLGVSVGVTDALVKHAAFAVVVCVCIAEGVAFVVADVVAGGMDRGTLGGLESFVALGVAGFVGISAAEGVADLVVNLVVVGVTIKAALGVRESVQESLKAGHPEGISRTIFGALVLAHVFLLYLSFLGGWRALA
jgi:hypothetical protein